MVLGKKVGRSTVEADFGKSYQLENVCFCPSKSTTALVRVRGQHTHMVWEQENLGPLWTSFTQDACMADHQSSPEDFNSQGELTPMCAQIVCMWQELEDLIFNMLAHSITKWNKVCDKRLARLKSYINQTKHYRQYWFVGHKFQDWKLGLFQGTSCAGVD